MNQKLGIQEYKFPHGFEIDSVSQFAALAYFTLAHEYMIHITPNVGITIHSKCRSQLLKYSSTGTAYFFFLGFFLKCLGLLKSTAALLLKALLSEK